MWRWFVVIWMACGAPPRPSPVASHGQACSAQPPIGDPSQFTLREVPGFAIAMPQTCRGASYIRISRAAGHRKLGTARVNGGGFGDGCMDPSKFDECDTINVGALLLQASTELRREGQETADLGAGPCAPDLNGDYSGWNFSVGVHDWKDMDRLVAKITELMDRYDLAGYVGASAYVIPCAFAD